MQSKCKWTPYHGHSFKGKPISTIINGEIKMKDDKIIGDPTGQPLLFE